MQPLAEQQLGQIQQAAERKYAEQLAAPPVMRDLVFSQQLDKIADALAQAQKEMGHASKDATNPYFQSKYADLASVIDAAGPLHEHGISIVCIPLERDGLYGVHCRLVHKSGQYMGGTLLLPVSKKDAQGAGSSITYARRYCVQSLCNIGAEDDDANGSIDRKAPRKEHSDKGNKRIGKPREQPMKEVEPNPEEHGLAPSTEKGDTTYPSTNKFITQGQASNFQRSFKDACPSGFNALNESHQWLLAMGYVDETGQPTAKRIPAGGWLTVKQAAVAYAKGLK